MVLTAVSRLCRRQPEVSAFPRPRSPRPATTCAGSGSSAASPAGGPGSVVAMYVKLCGLRTEADVAVAVDAGADAVGFVFTRSARQVDLDTAKRLVAAVPAGVLTVGVFAGVPAAEAGSLAVAAGVGA